jgi:hypothetical protein
MIIYLACTAALLKLRRAAPQAVKGAGRRLVRILAPLVAAALCIWAAAQAKLDAWAVLAVFAAIGAVLYALNRWRPGARSPIYSATDSPSGDP